MTGRSVTGVVLAAGGSSRLGPPKQLIPYGGTSLLGASVDAARACGFDQLIVTIGGAADAVRQAVPLEGIDVVTVVDFGSGCSSSLRAAITPECRSQPWNGLSKQVRRRSWYAGTTTASGIRSG